MHLQPGQNAIRMINMLTGELLCLFPEFKRIFTNSTLRGIRSQQFISNLNIRKALNSGFGGRRRPVAVWIIFCELLNQLLETRANKVIAKIGREAESSIIGVVILDDELNISTTSSEGVEVILKECERVKIIRTLESD